MANKLLFVALALAALVAFADVSAHRTITTTTIDDEAENPRGRGGSQGQCRQQAQRQGMFHCAMQLLEGGRSSYDDGETTVEMPVENPRGQQGPHLQLCCQELQNMEEQCACDAMQEALREAQQVGQHGGYGQDMQQMMRMAQELPRQCGMEAQGCQFRFPRI